MQSGRESVRGLDGLMRLRFLFSQRSLSGQAEAKRLSEALWRRRIAAMLLSKVSRLSAPCSSAAGPEHASGRQADQPGA